MDTINLLRQLLGAYKKFPKGEYYFNCPFCRHPKNKFAINEHNLMWHCWHCNNKGNIFTLLKVLNIPNPLRKNIYDSIDQPRYHKSMPASAFDEEDVQLFLPREYLPLWEKPTVPEQKYPYMHAVSYLIQRGIKAVDIYRYRLGWCMDGPYKDRIIIPSYDKDNKLNYFTARSFYDIEFKYKNPPISKNIICFENFVSWDEPIILCEGMFDAIAIRRNAIPLLGKNISTSLKLELVYHKSKVVVYLDKDARSDALEMEQDLKRVGVDARIVQAKDRDASELGFEETQRLIDSAKSTDWKDFIFEKVHTL